MLSLHMKSAVVGLVVVLEGCDVNVTQTTPTASTGAPTSDISVPAPATTPPAPATSTPTAAPESSHQASVSPVVGGWSSPSCGDRKYTRTIRFDDKGGFAAQDLVSPCPPDAKCIWSGIVDRKGSYVAAGKQLKLTITNAPKGPGAAFPETLELSPGPTEKQGGVTCVYARL